VSIRLALVGIVAVSTGIRVLLGRVVHGPFVFMDELAYERMAETFARTGHFSLFHGGDLVSPLYPLVISPIYLATSSAATAYEFVKALNSLLLSLAVIPIYAIARSVLAPARALAVAALSLLLPLMFYSGLALSENLAYPLVLVAFWAMLRALREPRAVNDLLLTGAVLLAAAARLQNVVLLPAALTAVVLVPLLHPAPGLRRARAVGLEIGRHRTLFAGSLTLLAFVLVKRAVNGGAIPLAGIYANVGSEDVKPLKVVELAVQHLAELDLALGVAPFAGALLAAYLLVRRRFASEQLMFGAVAVSVTTWLLLEVAYASAALDVPGSSTSSPRIHERYLIYVLPLFLTAFVASLDAVRSRAPLLVQLAVAGAAAVLPVAIPFGRMINDTVAVDSLGLQMFAIGVHGKTRAVPHATIVAAVLGTVLAGAYLYSSLRRRAKVAVATTTIFLLMVSALVGAVHARAHLPGETAAMAANARSGWVDAATEGHPAILVGGAHRQRAALLLTAFQNLSITRVYATCNEIFGVAFGEKRLTLGRSTVLLDHGARVEARYVVAPVDLAVQGRVIARSPIDRFELVAPSSGALSLRRPLRCTG
jgi:hypothetical protein